MTDLTLTRRKFIQISGIALTGLVIGCSVKSNSIISGNDKSAEAIWVRIGEDGETTLIVPSSEMGQGIHTALAMILAEEMDLDWNKINVITGANNSEYEMNFLAGQLTGGSQSITHWWEPLRKIGANTRKLLVQVAAQKLAVTESELKTENSAVIHAKGSLTYAELIPLTAGMNLPSDAVPKKPEEYKWVGKSMPRLSNRQIVNAQAKFGLDIVLPDMLIGAIKHPPKFGAKLESFDREAAMKVKGVRGISEIPNGLAIVADHFWAATKGLNAANQVYSGGLDVDDSKIEALFDSELNDMMFSEGNQKSISAEYFAPYLAHLTMEPMNCTANFSNEGCEIWAPTQAQTLTAKKAAEVLDIDVEKVKIHTTLLGGGFGRRAETDFVGEAALMSKIFGKPVKLIWSREEDVRNDSYRPAAKVRFRADFADDGQGELTEVKAREVSISILKKFAPEFLMNAFGDPVSKEGLGDTPYEFPDFDYEAALCDPGIPVGFWRSVGHSFNCFFIESFIDEIADKLGKDPLEYRISLLSEKPRFIAVLNRLREISGWSSDNKNMGLAIHQSFGSIAAAVIDISQQSDAISLNKAYLVIDCGRFVNESTVKDQVSGGFIFGLSAAMYHQVNFKEGSVKQMNFPDFPMITASNCPEVSVEIMKNDEDPGGVGEPGTPIAAPALANAVYRLTGKRIRRLPMDQFTHFA